MKTINNKQRLIILMMFICGVFNLNAQVINGLSNNVYEENSAPIIIDDNMVISGGVDYGGGYLLFDLTNATINDQLGVTSDANPNALNAISFSSGILYLGNGTGKDLIGSIDAILDGTNGKDLKINFKTNFINSSFENGAEGWSFGLHMVDIGISSIAGFVTPVDPTSTPYNNNDGDSDVPSTSTIYDNLISTTQYTDGVKSLRLYSDNMITAESCDIVHGPYTYSSTFQSTAGDVIYFDWRAFAGGDAYDVFGYLLDAVTGSSTIILNETGIFNYDGGNYNTNWATASVSVPADGHYRFVFISGTYDNTCGRVAGASLYIDNVRVYGNKAVDAVVTDVAQHITYSNNCGSSDVTRNLDVTVQNNLGLQATASANIALNTYAPAMVCKNIPVYLDAAGQVSIVAADVDDGTTDACSFTLGIDRNMFYCTDVGPQTIVLTATDTYGNTASCNSIVTVIDNIFPIALCQPATVTLSGGSASITAQMIDNGSSDVCGLLPLSVSPNMFNCSNIGSNPVILSVSDPSGNVSTCTTNVEVIGVVPSCSIDVVLANNIYTGGDGKTIFLGYGPQSLTATATAMGGGPFTYSWSGGAGFLSSTTIANPEFTPTVQGNYTLVCTVTNSYGCEAICDVDICVMDIRDKKNKVFLCQASNGNLANAHTISISVNAIPAHLSNHPGDKLGVCGQSCSNLSPRIGAFGSKTELSIYPNPFDESFNLLLLSNSDENMILEIYDALGRLLMKNVDLQANEMYYFGEELPVGFYYIKIQQGEFVESVKVIKTN